MRINIKKKIDLEDGIYSVYNKHTKDKAILFYKKESNMAFYVYINNGEWFIMRNETILSWLNEGDLWNIEEKLREPIEIDI